MNEHPPSSQPNVLGDTSLRLGIASTALVFATGLCALLGARQGWLQLLAVPLFVCGATSAFLGLLGFGLGAAGLFNKERARATAAVGLALGMLGVCLFLLVLRVVGG
ncbi:MAG: hypothetical protein KC418_19550 [Anaerolineales bacterium]|nr:hypothetical protein [Anaerolineales bacterium]MCB8953275.1 hypothetical protein [Ardenticatenales bacterium]